ncbi:hypothetical protein FJT64_005281 [Amphibalanus amphitrite]|uniref:Uncharacterized protein n=1 Tax=Amphibalanus amphitrite TaxID=1232801 RepID=A0A6A4W2E4_AMPAM|nr:hypothetical protein FJT64_005281 [Amphibalanus amphitrite]
MLAAAAFAAAMGAAQGLDLDLASRMEDVIDPRFFIILNGSNTDNVGQYVLGAIGVVLVLGLLLMLLLLAFGGAGGGGQGLAYNRYDQYEPDTYASYQNNYQPAQGFNGFQARSLAGAITSCGADTGGFVPNPHPFHTAADLNSVYTGGQPSSYSSYKTANGFTVLPGGSGATSKYNFSASQTAVKQDRQGILLATQRPEVHPEDRDDAYDFSEYPPEDFNSYSREDLRRLRTKCYQFHYHYGPLYDVQKSFQGLRRTVQKTASNTARDFYTTTGRLSHAINRSANGFARFMGGLGGKVMFTVLATAAALLFISLLQIGINVSGRASVSGILDTLAGWTSTVRSEPAARSSRGLSAYDAIQVLYMLEQAFEKMRVLEFECQQRAVCETHQADAPQKFGQIATDIQKFIGSVDESTVENSSKFAAFREAARRGAEQQDCQQAYATKCPKGLREYLSAESKY